MPRNACLAFVVFIAFLPIYAYAGLLKGSVTDEQGHKLPNATVFIDGTTMGVNANGNGDYELALNPGLYKVICQYIGFQQTSFNVSVTGSETIEHNFVLKEHSLEMKEVVVNASAQDPAYRIMRAAIKKRKFHLNQEKTFQTSIYLKGVLRSRKMPEKFLGQKVTDATDAVDSLGRGILYLTEEDADYYRSDGHEKTIIHSVHESGNPTGLGFSQFPSVISFYDNNVNLLGRGTRGFISPVSENALLYYKYKLLGEFKEQDRTIYKIRLIPRRKYEPCFNGIVYIVDNEWAIHSLNVEVDKETGLDVADTLKVDQLYLPVENEQWVIKSQVLYFAVKILVFDITATGVTVYNNQKINSPIPDSIFSTKVISAYDKTATKRDSTYWKSSRPIPLETDEKENFVVKDSLVKKYTLPEYVDSLRRKENKLSTMKLLMNGYAYKSKESKNQYSINSLFWGLGTDNVVNYNIVEGFNVAPKVSFRHFVDTGKTLYADGIVRYGFSNRHLNAIGRVYYTTARKDFPGRTWTYGLEAGKYVFQYNPANPVSPWFNSFGALLYRENDLKLYERWDATAYLGRNYGNGVAWYVKTSYQQRLPLDNTSTYSFVKGDLGGFKSNTPPLLVAAATDWKKNDAALLVIGVNYKPGYTFTQFPDKKLANGSNWPLFSVVYKKGIKGIISSISDFDYWRFSVHDDINLKLPGFLKYHVAAGGFLNDNYVSIPDLVHLYGNRGAGYAGTYLESFQFAPFYDFSSKSKLYGEAHVEWHLNGFISNKIPVLRTTMWYFLAGGNVFYSGSSNWYSEWFVGLDNIGYKLLRLARVDFVQSFDSHHGTNSGIRFSLTIGNSARPTFPLHSEW